VLRQPSLHGGKLVERRSARAARETFQGRFFDPLRYEVSPDWGGELPLTLLIDKAGTITTIAGVTDLSVVRKWLAGHAR